MDQRGPEGAAWQAVVVDALDQAVVLYDEHGSLLHANPAAGRLVGRRLAPGADALDVAHDVRDALGRPLRHEDLATSRALASGRPAEHVVSLQVEGRTRWLHVRSRPVQYAGRRAAVTSLTDVTEQQQAERDLRTGEARLEAILDATPAVIYTKDLDGRFTFVNRGFAELFGRTRDEVIGATDHDLVEQGLADQLRANDRLVVQGDGPVSYLEYVPRDGVGRTWISVKVPLRDDLGEVYGLAGISTDITEQTRAAGTSALLEAATEASRTGVVTFDAELAVTSWNLGAQHITGVAADRAVGRRLAGVIGFAGEVGEVEVDDAARAVLGGERRTHELRFTTLGGEAIEVEVSMVPILAGGGRVVGGAVIGRDVTAHRAAEVERASLQRDLEHLGRLESLGQLAGGVAHDFNNLLAAINLTAEMLVREVPEGSPAHRYAEQVLGITARGVALTRQMLVFARRELRQHTVVDLNEVVRRADQLLERTLGPHVGRDLRLAASPVAVEGEPSQLEQVVVNLALNARDAMSAGGTLVLGTGLVELDAADVASLSAGAGPGPYVVLTAADDGHGMDERTLAHALEPFFTTKPMGQGTGLGLSMVHGVAGQAGGGVRVESAPGAGTTVRVYLPVAQSAPVAEPATRTEPPPGRGELVLVVEDSTELRTLVREVLERAGYLVVACADAGEARAAAAVARPALLLSDVVMPGGSGHVLARELRQEQPGLPVLLVSGYDDLTGSEAEHSEHLVLEKPFTSDDLLTALRVALDGPH